MLPLREIPTVKETEHLEPQIQQIAEAVFGREALYVDWRGRQDDQGSLRSKVADGILWLPKKADLWLIELEWKLGSNYLDQVKTFSKAKVGKKRLQRELAEELEKNAETIGIHPSAVEYCVQLTMEKWFTGSVLEPNMWVVLGHDGDNISELLQEYQRATGGFFRDREYLVTMVRWFSDDVTECVLLDNHWSTKPHDACVVPLCPLGRELPKTAETPVRTDSTCVPEQSPKVHKAKEVWAWFEENYPGLKQENLWLRLQPGFDCFHDFEIAWKKEGYFLWVLIGKTRLKPTTALKRVFPDRDIPTSVAQKWGKYIDVSEDPARVLASCNEVDRILRQPEEPYDRDSRERQPCSEFFRDDTTYTDIKSRRRLWEAFLEKRVLSTKDLVKLTGIAGKGRSASLDHKLTRYSIIEREGDEFRLTDEALPYVEKMLVDSDHAD